MKIWGGNRMLKYTDFFDLINHDEPIAALFMTYGFDAELFEHHILPAFLGIIDDPKENELRYRNQIALSLKEIPIAVLSDGRQYNGGRTFIYDQITIKSQVFHPKCHMLLFKDFLRVIVSSGNLTRGGLCYNAETIWYEDIYPNSSSTISNELLEILQWMISNYELEKIEALKEIVKFIKNIEPLIGFPKIKGTINSKSIYSQVIEEVNNYEGTCKTVTIISPFFENDRDIAMEGSLLESFYEEFINKYPQIKLKIYFPGIFDKLNNYYKVDAPKNIFTGINKYKNVNFYIMPSLWEADYKKELVSRNLHAKLIIMEFDSGYELRLSGSINFTNNAMRSNLSTLRNIEIGVMEHSKTKFNLPKATKVNINKLHFIERPKSQPLLPNFVDLAVFDGIDLYISFNINKIIVPFSIKYNANVIREVNNQIENLIIRDFKLKKSKDLEFIIGDDTFFIPILVANKEDIITEDEKLDIEIYAEDIIDFLAGKYKSVSELERTITSIGSREKNIGNTIYFRQNLQRYYKAMASLKQGLESPHYSELSFKNYINNPIGLKNLVNLILTDYKEKQSSKGEYFLFIIEILNVVHNLEFKEDRINNQFKIDFLNETLNDLRLEFKHIYKTSKGKFKSQCKIMINNYGLDV